MSTALWLYYWNSSDAKVLTEDTARPRVGVAMRIGSNQEWWQTTRIEEIVKDTPNEVIFRTKSGSVYTWRTKNASS